MNKIDSFSKNEFAVRNHEVNSLLQISSEKLQEYLSSDLKRLGDYPDETAIIMNNFIRPVYKLVQNGWSDDEIIGLETWDRIVASKCDLSSKEYFAKKNLLGLTDNDCMQDAIDAIVMGDDLVLKRMGDSETVRRYIKAVPGWVGQNPLKKLKFIQSVYIQSSKEWYFKYLSELSSVEYDMLSGECPNIFLSAIRRVLPEYVKDKLSGDIFWVAIYSSESASLYPIYDIKSIVSDLQQIINLASLQNLPIDIVIRDRTLNIYLSGICIRATAFPSLDMDSEDPVEDYLSILAEKVNCPVSPQFTQQERHSNAFIAYLRYLSRDTRNKDWYLYLMVPSAFRDVVTKPIYGTLADMIIDHYPLETFTMEPMLGCNKVCIAGKTMPIYTAEVSGMIRKNVGREVILLGTDETTSASFDYSYNHFINWLQQYAKRGVDRDS